MLEIKKMSSEYLNNNHKLKAMVAYLKQNNQYIHPNTIRGLQICQIYTFWQSGQFIQYMQPVFAVIIEVKKVRGRML